MRYTIIFTVLGLLLNCAGKPAIKVNHSGNEAARQLAKRHFSVLEPKALAEYPKVVVPNYQIGLQTTYFMMNKGNVLGRLAKTTGTMEMTVSTDPAPLAATLKEVSALSRARFKKKLTAFGFEVLDEQELKNSSEDVKKWYAKKLEPSTTLDLGSNQAGVLYGAEGASTSGCNFTRDIKAGCQIPTFTIALGAFVDSDGPGVIKATHENVQLFFKPEIQISNGTIFNGEYRSGMVTSKSPLSVGELTGEVQKTLDTSADASARAQRKLDWANAMGKTDRIFAFSHGNKQFELNPDPAQLRAALLDALDIAENLTLEIYADELK